MKIILIETLENIGKAGQILTVKDGFARNYLLPKKFAVLATPNNLKKVETITAEAKAKAEKRNAEFKLLADKINALEVAVFTRRAEEDGKLFGSVSEVDLIKFLADHDVHVSKNNIQLDKHIKTTGENDVKIFFSTEISAMLKIRVEAGG